MNILFALPGGAFRNYAQPRLLAARLTAMGYGCCLAVASETNDSKTAQNQDFCIARFRDLSMLPSCFPNGEGPQIIHAWTLAEDVLTFAQSVCDLYRSRLFVHFEGKEPSQTSRALETLPSLSGITVAIENLKQIVPSSVPVLELWPSADPHLFRPQSPDPARRRRLGVPENTVVLVYPGNATAINARDMRSLYLAVAVLNREGVPTTLVRAGLDIQPFLRPDDQWRDQNTMELGRLPHSEVPDLLALADILVQPGNPGPYNYYRVPQTVPEFLSVGRPVILPETNLALQMTHRHHAFLLKKADALSIAATVREITSSPELYAALSAGALEFSRGRLDPRITASNLEQFYRRTVSSFHSCPK